MLKWFRNSAIVRLGAGEMGMRTIWAVVIAASLGLGLGACSKCDIPDLLPKACKAGPGTNGM
jgi:hypothetical protein